MTAFLKGQRSNNPRTTTELMTSILRINGFPVRMTQGMLNSFQHYSIPQVYVESTKQWYDFENTRIGSAVPLLRMQLNRDTVTSNGLDIARSEGEPIQFAGYDLNAEGVGLQVIKAVKVATDTKTPEFHKIEKSDPNWIDATPRIDSSDILIQAEKMKSEVTGNWKVETPDWFFYIGEGSYAFLRNGAIGNTVSFEAPVRNGTFKLTGMFFTGMDQGQYDVSINQWSRPATCRFLQPHPVPEKVRPRRH